VNQVIPLPPGLGQPRGGGPQHGAYDVVIIGSGLGALSTASLLAKLQGMRVLVVERHSVIGGFTHTFQRKGGYRWDVGLHYVGGMNPGSVERRIANFVTDGALDWIRMSEPFDKLVYPDFTFDVYGDGARFEQELIARFPDEAEAIRRYLQDVVPAMRWIVFNAVGSSGSRWARAAVRLATRAWQGLAQQTTAEYLERAFRCPELKAVLSSRWGLQGLPPSQSSFGFHAMLMRHYLTGGFYPAGGSARIAETIVPIVEQRGGAFVSRQEVTRILLSRGRAVGVEARDRRGRIHRYEAGQVVSNAGAYNTYAKLLPPRVGAAHARRLGKLAEQTLSAVTVYLGLDGDPRELGFRGENVWISERYDHETGTETEQLLAGRPERCFLSFPSLRDDKPRPHTAEILAFARHEDFAAWHDTRWRRRGADYDALKQRLADGLIDLVERRYPGFKGLIDRVEVSTPLSVEHFTASPFGAIYGLPGTPARFRETLVGTRTPIGNLYLTGADGFVFGILGALLSGVATAGAVTGRLGFLRVLAAILRAEPKQAA
jgi:phytoene dehydrogenase-like protein